MSSFSCQWANCQDTFKTAEDLYNHLSDDHVGRRSTNNLCLQCCWNNCGTVAIKRDHLASHIRVHLPLKPHACSICKKGFKRPQDLKKHEKIHTEEHQSSLLSKQPGYRPVRRRRKTNTVHTPSPHLHVSDSTTNSDLSSLSYSPSSLKEIHSPLGRSPSAKEDMSDYRAPVNDLLQEMLHDQTFTNYDSDMINQLNSIGSTIDYMDNLNWSVPADAESAQVLQDWLEQLSANVRVKEEPAMTQDYKPTFSSFLSNQQDTLYPSLNKMAHEPYLSVSTYDQQSTELSTTPNSYVEFQPQLQEFSASPRPAMDEPGSELGARFWSPSGDVSSGSYTTPKLTQPEQYPTPYEPYNSSQSFVRSPPSVNQASSCSSFQTDQHVVHKITPTLDPTNAFNSKKDIVHMMNVFSSPEDAPKKKKNTIEERKKDKEELICQTIEEESSTSPYAELVNMIGHMNMNDQEYTRNHVDSPQETICS